VIGAVTGSPDRPERLILGLPGPVGDLRIAGSTLPLKPDQVHELAGLLQPVEEQDHPWSAQLLTRHLAAWGPSRRPIITVAPTIVAEVETGTAEPPGKWRELARLRRLHPELALSDLPAAAERP
jgi:hypothetical protein